jgi:hypothetical protein
VEPGETHAVTLTPERPRAESQTTLSKTMPTSQVTIATVTSPLFSSRTARAKLL